MRHLSQPPQDVAVLFLNVRRVHMVFHSFTVQFFGDRVCLLVQLNVPPTKK